MSAGYQVLPLIYDRWQKAYGADYSTLILPRLLATIRRYHSPTTSMVDIACGTGSLARMMAQRGWTVWGVDASERMVHEARQKFRSTRWPVTILRQDMRAIRLPVKVGLATSLFDSLNHILTRRELLRVFRGVHRTLEPGGYFVFDVNNELCFEKLWMRTETVHHRDFTIIMQNRYERGRKMAYSFVTIFLRSGNRYRRLGEIVRERCFAHEEVHNLLGEAGFVVVDSEDFNFTDMPDVGKIKTWWVARKPSTQL
jgi:SAM-dependent methyltransferase